MCGAFSGINAAAQLAPELSLKPESLSQTGPTETSLEEAISAYDAGNTLKALVIAERHAKDGNSEAQVMAGHILLRGNAGFVDADKAAQWFRKAAEQKDSDAYMALGEMALRSQAGLAPTDAMPWFAKASSVGRGDAYRAIGEMYLKGTGIPEDIEKGQDWLQRAVDLSDPKAARILGDSFFETDVNRALSLYERAASFGDSDAAYIAAIILTENLDVQPDATKRADLLLQAAEAGHAAAQADYGLIVYQGAGVPQSTRDAASWFEKSAKGGDSEGQFLYAFTLAKGEGVAKSFEDAYYWLLKSGESEVDDYQQDRKVLRERLEDNVDPAILERARKRLSK